MGLGLLTTSANLKLNPGIPKCPNLLDFCSNGVVVELYAGCAVAIATDHKKKKINPHRYNKRVPNCTEKDYGRLCLNNYRGQIKGYHYASALTGTIAKVE